MQVCECVRSNSDRMFFSGVVSLEQRESVMKKIGYFFGLCAYVIGSIGGFGYAAYCKAWFIAVCIVVLAYMAFGTAKAWFRGLTA